MVQQTITFRKLKGLDTEQQLNLMNLQDLYGITNLIDLVSSFNSRLRTALDQMTQSWQRLSPLGKGIHG